MAEPVKNNENDEAKQVVEMISEGFDQINAELETYANMLEEEINKKVGSKGEENV
ncbi:hypothetical protein CCP3SC1AL1_320027 [Gammaproteobacteria bacterium]